MITRHQFAVVAVSLVLIATALLWILARSKRPGTVKTVPSVTSNEQRFQWQSKPALPMETTLIPQAEIETPSWRTEAQTVVKEYEALRAIEDYEGAYEVEQRFKVLLSERTAADVVKELPTEFLATYFGDLALRQWAETDRQAAAQWMASHPSDSPIAATAMVHNWVSEDLEGLHEYLDQMPVGVWKHNVIKSASEAAFVADSPTETIRLLDKIIGEDSQRDQLYEWAATKWAITDRDAAVKWAEQAVDPERRQKLLAATAIGYANVAPEAAADWAVTTITDSEALKPAITSVVRIWATQDPVAVGRWVEQFPAGAVRDEALEGLLGIWVYRDAAQAGGWQTALNNADLRAQAGQVLARIQTEMNDDGPQPVEK